MGMHYKLRDTLRVANVEHVKWTCIQLISVGAYTEVVDVSLTGRVIHVSVGNNSDGSFSV